MSSYKALAGGEVLYWNGDVFFWTPQGVYSFTAAKMQRHGNFKGERVVELNVFDVETNQGCVVVEKYPEVFDDYEILHRWTFGSYSCDCERGKKVYGPSWKCKCGTTRFVLRNMTIKGKYTNLDIKYKAFI